jgi:hypothetical protein
MEVYNLIGIKIIIFLKLFVDSEIIAIKRVLFLSMLSSKCLKIKIMITMNIKIMDAF